MFNATMDGAPYPMYTEFDSEFPKGYRDAADLIRDVVREGYAGSPFEETHRVHFFWCKENGLHMFLDPRGEHDFSVESKEADDVMPSEPKGLTLACDLDGTLVTGRGEVIARTRALVEAAGAGNTIVCTKRTLEHDLSSDRRPPSERDWLVRRLIRDDRAGKDNVALFSMLQASGTLGSKVILGGMSAGAHDHKAGHFSILRELGINPADLVFPDDTPTVLPIRLRRDVHVDPDQRHFEADLIRVLSHKGPAGIALLNKYFSKLYGILPRVFNSYSQVPVKTGFEGGVYNLPLAIKYPGSGSLKDHFADAVTFCRLDDECVDGLTKRVVVLCLAEMDDDFEFEDHLTYVVFCSHNTTNVAVWNQVLRQVLRREVCDKDEFLRDSLLSPMSTPSSSPPSSPPRGPSGSASNGFMSRLMRRLRSAGPSSDAPATEPASSSVYRIR